MVATLLGDLGETFGLIFADAYDDGILSRPGYEDNGKGTLTKRLQPVPVKVQVDTLTQQQRPEGYAESDVRLIVLASGLDKWLGEAGLQDDDEIEVPKLGRTFRIAGPARDPLGSHFTCRGRRKPISPPPIVNISLYPLAVADLANNGYSIRGASRELKDLFIDGAMFPPWQEFNYPPAVILPGVGFIVEPVVAGAVFTWLVATPELWEVIDPTDGGYSVVMEFEISRSTGPADTFTQIITALDRDPDYAVAVQWAASMSRTESLQTLTDAAGDPCYIQKNEAFAGPQKVAVSITPEGLASFLFGDELIVTPAPPQDFTTANELYIGVGASATGFRCAVSKVSYFKPQEFDQLESLLAL